VDADRDILAERLAEVEQRNAAIEATRDSEIAYFQSGIDAERARSAALQAEVERMREALIVASRDLYECRTSKSKNPDRQIEAGITRIEKALAALSQSPEEKKT
jgi:hypothetical protein